MEEILNKDLFNEKELLKYSPDYSPQDIVLRMQLRKETVKDTHKHGGSRNSSCQKKNIMKPKSCYKMKKEIVKLHTYFQNKNLQNQCMLKDVERANKKLHLCKKTDVANSPLAIVDENLIQEELALFMSDSGGDQLGLVIENNSEFKLVEKDKEIVYNNKKRNKNVVQEKNIQRNSIINNSFVCLSNGKTNTSKENNIIRKDNIECNEFSMSNEYRNDLQSLLIMMAINPAVDEDNDNEHDATYVENYNAVSNIGECNIEVPDSTKDTSKLPDKPEIDQLAELLNIQHLTNGLKDRQIYIKKKYINMWKVFVDARRENRMFQQRKETLNIFFDKLARKKECMNSNVGSVQKANVIARDYNTYRHRYKLQKHIIALQKAKLEEQNKVIGQLKFNNIVEASRQSLDTMREDIRKTYYEIDKHLKPKIKCLTNELKLKEIEEPSLVLHCLKVPQFIQRMEARAREREEKHAIIRERRKQMEEERIRLKQQAELEKAEMDKEAKVKRLKELREKRKREKIENIRRKQHAERIRALLVMADLHYEKSLMVKFGIRPLRRLLEITHDDMEKAKAHYGFQLLKNVFLNWMWHTEDMWFERNYKAENFYRKKLLNKCFISLQKNHYEYVLKKQVAEDYYDLYATQLVFRKFRESIALTKKELEIKWTKATMYYNSNVLFKTFTCWRSLPALNALKREQDARKMKWRQKVLLVVPDYKPPED